MMLFCAGFVVGAVVAIAGLVAYSLWVMNDIVESGPYI